jgi:hypothetical protein
MRKVARRHRGVLVPLVLFMIALVGGLGIATYRYVTVIAIAERSRGILAGSLLSLVESRLLVRMLSNVEIQWLTVAEFGDGEAGRDWLQREQALAARDADLRAKLPAGLPPEEPTAPGETPENK